MVAVGVLNNEALTGSYSEQTVACVDLNHEFHTIYSNLLKNVRYITISNRVSCLPRSK